MLSEEKKIGFFKGGFQADAEVFPAGKFPGIDLIYWIYYSYN